MLTGWRGETLPDLLARHGLEGAPEEPLATDGWSGASFATLEGPAGRFVLKRTSIARDWIARATLDGGLREGVVAAAGLDVAGPLAGPVAGVAGAGATPAAAYRGAAADGDGVAMLMPDLSAHLVRWDRPGPARPLDVAVLDRVLGAVARLHASGWWRANDAALIPWCPLRERLLLLVRPSAERYRADGNPVGARFLAGWDAFDRLAPPAAVDLVGRLAGDPEPLLAALGRLPAVGLHGDLKLANVAPTPDGPVVLIDWQMTTVAPVAVELGWLLVSNVDLLPEQPASVVARYYDAIGADEDRIVGDREAQADLAWIVGLLLRGWRKGLDAEAGLTLASGTPAAEDLAWWCRRALDAAGRRL